MILGNSHNLFLAFGLTAYTGLVTGIGGLIAFLAKHTDSCILSAFFFVSVMIYVSYGLIPELFFLFELYTEHTSYIYMLLLLLSGEILFLSNDKQEIIADSYLYLCVH